jgi:hemoglobin
MRAALLPFLACLVIVPPASGAPTLYNRLGGDAGVHAIADELIDRVAADPVHGVSFRDTNLKRVKRLLAEQLCDLAGGPCHYSGSPMKESHAGLHITQADFYDMVGTLRTILHEHHVATGATNELLRLLAPMKRDVVDTLPVAPAAQPAPAVQP